MNPKAPVDDGLCDHLTGLPMPSVGLRSTSEPSDVVDLSRLNGLTIVFCYPRTGVPGQPVSDEYTSLPGTKGCTPQACSFRDKLPSLLSSGVSRVFGMSTQSTDFQRELKQRTHLTYDILSDADGTFRQAVNLPTYDFFGTPVLRRITLAIRDGRIVKHWYPVFPPEKNVDDVLEWLKAQNH